MLRLMTNDFRLNAVLLFWVFLFFNVLLVPLARLGLLGQYGFDGIPLSIAFAATMVVGVFLREEQNKGQVLSRSLPISHSKVIRARYFSVCLIVIAVMLYGMFYQSVVGSIYRWPFLPARIISILYVLGYGTADLLITRALAVTLIIAVSIPFIVRYGTFWRILVGYVILLSIWHPAEAYLLRLGQQQALYHGSLVWILVAVVFMIATLGVSIQISTWLHGKREL